MCEADWKLILEYLKVFISWPVTAMLLGFIAIKAFSPSLSDLLKRLIKGQGYGISFEVQPQQPGATGEDTPKNISNDSDIRQWVTNNPDQAITQYEKLYKVFQCERILNLIYGTQIDLLTHLITQKDKGESYINIKKYHTEHQRRSENTNYNFNEYIQFLINF